MKKDLLSLFTGAGGLDHGFSLTGFNTVVAVDNSKFAVRTFNENVGKKIAVELDLAKMTSKDFLNLVPKGINPIGLVGGPPCQGFSRGNVFANVNDPRNTLPFRYVQLLKAANEKYGLHFFVFENVSDLTGPKHVKRFHRIIKKLEKAGFNVFHSVLNAADFGVPQRRKRVFIVGLNKKIYPEVKFIFPEGKGNLRTVADAIFGLPKPTFFIHGLLPTDIPYHQNHWTMMPRSSKLQEGVSSGRSFRRLKWNEISPTVAYGNREIHIHPDGGRRLSVLEAMLLQGFPKTYHLSGTLSAQITQISNAVPPPMAEAIAIELNKIVLTKK